MSQIILNRINISGPINKNTPLCVILEIAFSLNIDVDKEKINEYHYYNRLLKTIKDIKAYTVQTNVESYSLDDLQHIASFVNGNREIKWRKNCLLEAYKHLLKYYNKENIEEIEEEFYIGQKNPDNLYAFNACMLYRICIFYDIELNKNNTIEEMGYLIKNYSKSTEELREMMIFNITNISKKNLLNLLISSNLKIVESPNLKCPSVSKLPIKISKKTDKNIPNINHSNLTTNDLKETYKKLMDYNYYLNILEPNSQEQCIILTALIYGINLTQCSNPYQEYIELKNKTLNGTINNSYIPIYDLFFRKRYMDNPNWFNIRNIWEPKLTFLYSEENLVNFLKNEGYIIEEITTNYEDLLFQIRLTPTFYLGKYPNCNLQTTYIYMEPINDISNELLISYGILENLTFSIFTVNELAEYFLASKSFINPSNTNEIFSEYTIRKLKNFCFSKINNKKKLVSEVENNYNKLLNSIETVIKFNESIFQQGQILRNLYLSSSENMRKEIILILNYLLEIGYYMRGWKINSQELPIVITTYEIIKQNDVEYNSTKAIIKFEETIKTINIKIFEIIKTLPLITIIKNDGIISFKPSTNLEGGLTILERIKIVKEDKNINACIRTSSNYFLASGYYYLKICKNEEPFNISEMAIIS